MSVSAVTTVFKSTGLCGLRDVEGGDHQRAHISRVDVVDAGGVPHGQSDVSLHGYVVQVGRLRHIHFGQNIQRRWIRIVHHHQLPIEGRIAGFLDIAAAGTAGSEIGRGAVDLRAGVNRVRAAGILAVGDKGSVDGDSVVTGVGRRIDPAARIEIALESHAPRGGRIGQVERPDVAVLLEDKVRSRDCKERHFERAGRNCPAHRCRRRYPAGRYSSHFPLAPAPGDSPG